MGQPIRYEDFSAASRISALGEDENVELMLARARGQARAEGFAEGAAEAEARFDAELVATIEAAGEALHAAIGDDDARRRELGAALRAVVATFLTAFAPRLAEFNLVEEIAAAVAEAADDVDGGFVVELSPASKAGVVAGLGDVAASAVFRANDTLSPAEARVHWNGGFDEIDAAGAVTRATALIDARLAATALSPGQDPTALSAEDTFAAFDGSHDAEASIDSSADDSADEAALAPDADEAPGFDMAAPEEGPLEAAPDFGAEAGITSEMGASLEGDQSFGMDLAPGGFAESPVDDDAADHPDLAMDADPMGEPASPTRMHSDSETDLPPGDLPGAGEAALSDFTPLEDIDTSTAAPPETDDEMGGDENTALADLAAGSAFAPDDPDTDADDDFPALDFAFDAFSGADDETPPQ